MILFENLPILKIDRNMSSRLKQAIQKKIPIAVMGIFFRSKPLSNQFRLLMVFNFNI